MPEEMLTMRPFSPALCHLYIKWRDSWVAAPILTLITSHICSGEKVPIGPGGLWPMPTLLTKIKQQKHVLLWHVT